MKKEIILLLLLCTNFINAQEIHKSIKEKPKSDEKFISGKLTGFQNGDKISFYDPEIMETLDSTYIQNGSFRLKNPLDDMPKTIFILSNSGRENLNLILFIAGENIEISGDIKDFNYNLNVKGSKFQKEKDLLDKQTKIYQMERDSLAKYMDMDESNTSKANLELIKPKLKRIKEIDKITDAISIKYIKEHINTYYGLLFLTYYYDRFSKKEIQDLYNKLDQEHKKSDYGERVKTFLTVGKILEDGDTFYDFEAKGNDGQTHKLSEIKDQYILLDFNETYCGPCIASVSELKKIATEYKDLSIVSFCADKPEEIWKKGISRDKPEWLSLWDGKGTKGSTPVKYGVIGYPKFILIDKTGTIVSILDGYGKGEIEKMLKENIKL